MFSEIFYLLYFIAGIVLMVRFGLLRRFLSAFVDQRILDELSYLKVSAPDLSSTFDGNSSASPR